MTGSKLASHKLFKYGIGAFAGAASALILAFSLANSGSVLVLAAYIAAVPLFMAGLGAGILPGLLAAIVGGTWLFISAPASFGTFYLMADAVPAVVLTILALRRPPTSSTRQWSSEGNLLAMLAIYPCILFLVTYVLTLDQPGGLLGITVDAFEGMAGQVTAVMSQNGQDISPDMAAKVHDYLAAVARFAPALAMCAWLFSTIIAMAVAQGILQQQKWNLRPPFSLEKLHVPSWIIFAAAVTGLIGGFAPMPYGYVGLNLALILGVPFFFNGLAVIHAYAAGTRYPTAFLAVFYTVISILVHLTLLVALLGAVDQWADFRKRFAGRPNL